VATITKGPGFLRQMASALADRLNTIAKLGKSFGTQRDIYQECGYPATLEFADYNARYSRQDVSVAIIEAYPTATWGRNPEIVDDPDPKIVTPFEKAWRELVVKTRMYHYLLRTDIVAGVGEYGVLVLGFNDGNSLDKPLVKNSASRLLYLQPYSQEEARITKFDRDPTSERFGKPEMYTIDVFNESQYGLDNRKSGRYRRRPDNSYEIHHSRVLHIADNTTTSDTFGRPRAMAVYNRLQDIETIVAGGAEMFWRLGFPGYSFEADADADLTQTQDALDAEMKTFAHGLTRYLRLQGVTAKVLESKVTSPKEHVETQLTLISASTRIPRRILIGNEQGQLASTSDDENWEERVAGRRSTFATPLMVLPMVERMVFAGVVPAPVNPSNLIVNWPPLGRRDEKTDSTVARNYADALAKYVMSGSNELMPFDLFLSEVMHMEQEKVDVIMKEVKNIFKEENDDMDAVKRGEGEDE